MTRARLVLLVALACSLGACTPGASRPPPSPAVPITTAGARPPTASPASATPSDAVGTGSPTDTPADSPLVQASHTYERIAAVFAASLAGTRFAERETDYADPFSCAEAATGVSALRSAATSLRAFHWPSPVSRDIDAIDDRLSGTADTLQQATSEADCGALVPGSRASLHADLGPLIARVRAMLGLPAPDLSAQQWGL